MSQQKSSLQWFLASQAGGAVLLTLALTGCGGDGNEAPEGSGRYRPADDQTPAVAAINAGDETGGGEQVSTPAGNTAVVRPADQPAIGGTPARPLTDYTVPDGNTDELLAFMQKLHQQPPQGATQAEMIADLKKMQRARLKAADKVLGSQADVESQLAAVNHKVVALRILEETGETGIREQIESLGGSLTGSADARLAELGRMILFSSHFDAFMSSENPDPTVVMTELKGLLESPQKTDEMFQLATSTIGAFSEMGMRTEAVEAMRATGQAYRNSDNEQIAASAASMLQQVQVLDLGLDTKIQKLRESDPVDPAVAQELQAVVQQLIQAKADDQTVLDVGQMVARELKQKDCPDEAMQVLRTLGETFQGREDEHLSTIGGELLVQSRMIQRGFEGHVKRLILGEPGAAQNVVAAVQDLLRNEKPGETVLASITQAAEHLEHANEFAAEQQVIDMIEAVYANHAEEDFAAFAKDTVASARKRISLVNRPFAVHGTTLDGKPFDWTPYKGKVVLVDFWATWCGPCLAEVPNIKRLYEAYRDQGFEVVSVNLDDSRDSLDAWLAPNPNALPWPIVVSDDPAKAGFETPLAVECGVQSLPFILLINREGMVEAMHVRGSDLDKRLAEKFGPIPGGAELGGAAPGGAATGGAATGGAFPASGDGAAHKSDSRTFEPEVGPVFFTALADEEAGDAAAGDDLSERNPYLAPPGLSDGELVEFLLDMSDKPRVIQERPGFAEAVIEAAERLAAMDTKPNYKRLAILSKLRTLHRLASFGDEKADEQLAAYVDSLKDNDDAKVAAEVKFLRLERAAINVDDLPIEKVPELLEQLQEFFAAEKNLDERHLRIASNTVRAVNRLDDDEQREKHFAEFGKLFAASRDKQLAAYGKKLSKSPADAESDLVGKELELTGLTSLGAAFDWKSYRGKVVIVDFWATWCGPCLREMPHVRELHAKLKDKGFDVVGVSLDKDQDALAKFLEENDVPWENLAGEQTQQLAQKYGVRAIPTMMLVDRDGKVVAVSHQVETLAGKAKELLEKAAE